MMVNLHFLRSSEGIIFNTIQMGMLSREWTLRIEPFTALHRPSGTRCLKQ